MMDGRPNAYQVSQNTIPIFALYDAKLKITFTLILQRVYRLTKSLSIHIVQKAKE